MRPLKILTFNIAHGRGLSLYQGFVSIEKLESNLDKIAELITLHAIDIVALQEVDEDSHWNKGLNLLEHLREAAGFQHAYMWVNTRREHPQKQLCYGNAILSKYPILVAENMPFGQATLGEKGFMYAEIDWNGEVLPFVNLHLDYRSRKRRIVQIEQLIDFISQKKLPERSCMAPIICGDFNSSSRRADDAVAHLFDYILSHGEYRLYPEDARTFPARLPQRKIDFIFLPRPLEPTQCDVLKVYLSDHRPVLLNTVLA